MKFIYYQYSLPLLSTHNELKCGFFIFSSGYEHLVESYLSDMRVLAKKTYMVFYRINELVVLNEKLKIQVQERDQTVSNLQRNIATLEVKLARNADQVDSVIPVRAAPQNSAVPQMVSLPMDSHAWLSLNRTLCSNPQVYFTIIVSLLFLKISIQDILLLKILQAKDSLMTC